MTDSLLTVRSLTVEFEVGAGRLRAVNEVGFTVSRGESVAVVGESGSGKSVSALSIIGLLPATGHIVDGSILFGTRDLVGLSERQMCAVRGTHIGMIFQDAQGSLNPVRTIGSQLAEAIRRAKRLRGAAAKREALRLLDEVGLSKPDLRLRQYPHELSGGMNQRAAIAIALAAEPELLIADEATTALDATAAQGIHELLRREAASRNMGLIFISHDLRSVASFADTVVIMYAGHVVEQGTATAIFSAAQHPYTQGLLASMPGRSGRGLVATMVGGVPDLSELPSGCVFHPRCARGVNEPACQSDRPRLRVVESGATGQQAACHYAGEAGVGPLLEDVSGFTRPRPAADTAEPPLLEVSGLTKVFPGRRTSLRGGRTPVTAVDQIDLTVRAGETLALVGESGSGKTTTARMILGLEPPTAGVIRFEGRNITTFGKDEMLRFRSDVQAVFQSPSNSLNPKMTVRDVIAEPLAAQGYPAHEQAARVDELLQRVGLRVKDAERYPFEFSGGQKQRIGIARALATHPKLLICDEPVTALDVSVQGTILNLLMRLQAEEGVAYLIVAHDLDVVRQVADNVAVMLGGKIIEYRDADAFFRGPAHPFSRQLLASARISAQDVEPDRSIS